MFLLSLILASQVNCASIPKDTLSLKNINDNSSIHNGIEYNVLFDNMVGHINMSADFRDMNKRNNWNYAEYFDIDFSIARPLLITESISKRVKQYKSTINTQLKSNYRYRLFFKRITDPAAMFGDDIDAGKIKLNSILITCMLDNETLFIFQSHDNMWYYFTILN